MSDFSNSSNSKNVINFAEAKAKKQIKEDLAQGRQPLYISHLDGKLKGSPHLNGAHLNAGEHDDFGDRLGRIKTTLEKINRLMSELRRTSKEETAKANDAKPISIIKPL